MVNYFLARLAHHEQILYFINYFSRVKAPTISHKNLQYLNDSYKVIVIVKDQTEKISFTLFNREAQ